MTVSALALSKKDNVATAVRPLESGADVAIDVEDSIISVVLTQSIPLGHKFALRDIEPGESIIKYGETVGRATVGISKGEHVHIHNVEGLRGRGDRA